MDLSEVFPKGRQRLYQALQDAGVPAAPQRNVPWINTTADGTIVMNLWRRYIEERGNQIVAQLDARHWEESRRIAKQKCRDVVAALEGSNGRQIRVVVLEESSPGSRHSRGARYDHAQWLVEDTGEDFMLWRGRAPLAEPNEPIPPDPVAFGHINPVRKEHVSTQIERDPQVRRLTLQRAGNHCERPSCTDEKDFATPEVHHITRLGDGGADHTDNTVALCPACHARVHKGIPSVKRQLDRELERIRNSR